MDFWCESGYPDDMDAFCAHEDHSTLYYALLMTLPGSLRRVSERYLSSVVSFSSLIVASFRVRHPLSTVDMVHVSAGRYISPPSALASKVLFQSVGGHVRPG
jgi:hypothetical protein